MASTCDVNRASGQSVSTCDVNRASGQSANTCDVNRASLVSGRPKLAMSIEQGW